MQMTRKGFIVGTAALARLVALLSLTAMTLLFVMPAAWVCVWFGWLPRAQLLPAVMSGEVVVLALIAVSVALFGRLYCLVVCPLGIAQDVARVPLKFLRLKGLPIVGWVRYVVLAAFSVGAVPHGRCDARGRSAGRACRLGNCAFRVRAIDDGVSRALVVQPDVSRWHVPWTVLAVRDVSAADRRRQVREVRTLREGVRQGRDTGAGRQVCCS